MTATELIVLALVVFVVLPVISYMVVKFGTMGYFRAKKKNEQQERNRHA